MLDASTGDELATIPLKDAGDLEAGPDGSVFVISGGTSVLGLGADGTATPVVTGLTAAKALAIGPDSAIYVAVGDPDNVVRVFDANGKPLRTIGRPGGRPLLGPWDAAGMRFVSGLRLDAKGVGESKDVRLNAADGARHAFIRTKAWTRSSRTLLR